MINRDTVKKIFLVGGIKPFDTLTEEELFLLAQNFHKRTYKEGEIIIENKTVCEILFIRTSGVLMPDKFPVHDIFDIYSVLFGEPAEQEVRAGAGGVEVLCVSRSNFVALARECPDFIINLAEELKNR